MNLSRYGTTIESSRCTLMPLEPANLTMDYAGWLNDPEINEFLESRFEVHTLESVQKFVQAAFHSPDTVLFGIYVKPNLRHIGNVKLSQINEHHLTGELGFLIGDKSLWGMGYATEAISAVSDWAFAVLNLEKLTAGCYAGNPGSRRALEKAGFAVEATLANQVRDQSGARQNVLRFALHNQAPKVPTT